jgi:hypothetical protein
MRSNRRCSALVPVLSLFVAVLGSGCGDSDETKDGGTQDSGVQGSVTSSSTKAKVTFNVTDIDAALEGKMLYLKLIGTTDDCMTSTAAPLYSCLCVVTSGACLALLPAVGPSAYNVCAFIDANDDSGASGAPNAGDRVGTSSVQVSADHSESWSASGWTTI